MRAALFFVWLCSVAIADPAINRLPVGPGKFVSVLPTGGKTDQALVPRFVLDRTPVTNAEFLAFVSAHPQWRRGQIATLFADDEYLSHWASATELGANARPDQPVTRVSWFPARAYCQSVGARLPTWYEWEYAAAADERQADARADPAWREKILDWYGQPTGGDLADVGQTAANYYGINDLHGLVWEWVEDFNALMVSGDSRNQGDPDKLKFCGAGAPSLQDRDNFAVLMRVAFLSALEARSTAPQPGIPLCCGSSTVNWPALSCAAWLGMFPGGALLANSTDAASHPGQVAGLDSMPGADQLPGDSLYQLPVTLTTSEGATLKLADLRGEPLVITMFYTHCTSVCPLLTLQLQRLMSRLPATAQRQVHVLMVSFDSLRDTPEVLSAFRMEHHIQGANWLIARASSADVRALAAVLGIQFRELEDHSYSHSAVISVTDRAGTVRSRTTHLSGTDEAFVHAIRAQIEESGERP
jgi:formylglycine-generating enzyme